MKFPGKSKQQHAAPGAAPGGGGGGGQLRRRLNEAEKQVATLRRRVEVLEQEVQEGRQLNRQVAEMLDVMGEVLLPAEQRDEERLHALLARYHSTL